MQITIKLIADVLEVRCADCQSLLDMHSNRRDAYFPAEERSSLSIHGLGLLGSVQN
jgi:hypothetical protein